MKRISVLVIYLFIVVGSIQAQKWIEMMEDPRINFYDVQREFYSYYVGKTMVQNTEPRMDGPYSRFKAWEYYMEPRVYPTGIRPDPMVMYAEWLKQKSQMRNNRAPANWSFIGPSAIPSNEGGAGIVNCVSIDPVNTQIIWIGTGGGVWKSLDGGNSWNTSTDQQLPSLFIIDLALNPVNTNIAYVSLREGVFKTTDAGVTWFNTGLNKTSYRVQIDPANPNIMLTSCVDGMYRTTDGGGTWSQVTVINSVFGKIDDIEFNPGNSNIVYASDLSLVYRSVDNGLTWNVMSTGMPTNPAPFGIRIAITPANPDYVYALLTSYYAPINAGFYALCRSTDAGLSWTVMSTTPNILGYDTTGALSGGQGAYCMSLDVSPLNANEVYAGGINLWKSTNGGVNWTVKSDWVGAGSNYIHADQQDLKFQPGSGSVLYSCNDGGINVSYDAGATWTDLSDGLGIMQFYKLSNSATDPDLIVGGSQDNGTNKSDSGIFSRINVGDGMECIIDYTDPNTIYTSFQYGNIYRSTDGGVTNILIAPSTNSNFLSNYSMNPLNSKTLYAAYDEVFKTTNGGNSWTALTSGLYPSSGGGFSIPVVAAPSDTNTIYVGRLTELYRTTNDGITWDTLTTGISNAAFITGLAIDPLDANTVWITYSGYSSYSATSTDRVFKTTDGGATWNNITYTGLPAAPINCIVYQNGTPDALYVGTDIGVYYIDNTMSGWIPYTAGLPNVRVMDLEIQYASGKLRAATYGRGFWETDLNTAVVNLNDAGIISIINPTGTICNDSVSPVVELKNFGSANLTSAIIKYQIDAGPVNTFAWTGSVASFASVNVNLPTIVVTGASHILTANTILPNSVADGNATNDSAIVSFAYPVGLTLPYSEGFEGPVFPPSGITGTNSDLYITWERTTAASFSGLASAWIENMLYAADGRIDELILPYFDFSSATPLLTFRYAYQLRANPIPVNYYSDTLVVEVSTDCGNSWTIVYKKFDLPLVTTVPTFNETIGFVPTSTSQWAYESVDLSGFTSSDKVSVKFQNINGRGNNLYLDDINIVSSTAGIQKTLLPNIDVYPNPNNGAFVFSIQNGKAGSEVVIYNVLGELVHTSSLVSGTNFIDITNNSSGMYFYKLKANGTEVANGKLILK